MNFKKKDVNTICLPYIYRMEKIRTIKINDELHKKAVQDAKDLGLNLSSYIRYLLTKANKEKGENK